MTLDQFSQYLSWGLYVLIFVVATIRAVRRPIRANIDVAILFSLPALIIGISLATATFRVGTDTFRLIEPGRWTTALAIFLILAMGYMLLRLVDDFSDVPQWVMRSSEILLVLFTIAAFALDSPLPKELAWIGLLEVAYLVVLLFYSVVAFVRESRLTSGVTKRRMRAVAGGSIALCILFLFAGLYVPFPELRGVFQPFADLLSVGSGVSYFLGFATPTVLRRAWQEPELRAFLGRAASLPRLPDTEAIVSEMERGAARSLGAANARIGLWDEGTGTLRFAMGDREAQTDPHKTFAGRAFLTQKPIFTDNLQRDKPDTAHETRAAGAVALLAAPITAGEKRLGILTVYAPRAPIFADEDLELVQLLADQAAVILESRALIDEAARVRAHEQATRMKEDFLSAAAHDLKTPLTTLVVQSELLERRAMRAPDAPADLEGLRKMRKEVHRLKTFVLELLDGARAEQGKLVGAREEIDLVASSEEVCARHSTGRHPCTVEAKGSIIGTYDPNRISQLIENLVENAVKYSPDGGPVQVKLWRGSPPSNDGSQPGTHGQGEEGWNHITVADRGIGIPKEDIPHLFDRFHRGSNVDDRSFAGMGLGLFICKGIVEQHGGRIWVDPPTSIDGNAKDKNNRSDGTGSTNDGNERISTGEANSSTGLGIGTTFHVVLPVTSPATLAQAAEQAHEREFSR